MEPMSNADYLTRLQHADELKKLKAAKKASGLTYAELADKVDVNKVRLASVFDGQKDVAEEYCAKIAEAVGLPEGDTMFLS